MKITLHVGPHKTGTTSLQTWMLENSANHLSAHGIFYPLVEKSPPGHATVAWSALGLNGQDADPAILESVIEEASTRGAQHLVLSSEEFCRGLLKETLTNLRVLGAQSPLDLVVTLTPLPDRFVSEVVEQLKFSATFDLADIDLPEFCLRRPGLWPDLVTKLRDEIRPSQTYVILGDKKYPNFLIESFAQILGIPKPNQAPKSNQRFSYSRARLLNFVNAEFIDMVPKKRRELSAKLNEILRHEGLVNRVRPIRLPEKSVRFLDKIWALQLDYLRVLERAEDIKVFSMSPLEEDDA